MARATTESRSDTRLPPDDVKAAADAALKFPIEQANELRFPPDWLMDRAREEAAFGKIGVDPQGLTPGTRLHIIEPARALLARWRQARRQFDVLVEPKMPAIHAAREVDTAVAAARERTARDEAEAEDRLEADQSYIRVRSRFREAEDRYQRLRADHDNRDANMLALNPAYWVALLCIGVAEWLINYDVFFLFAGVVAIAAGATIIMGVLLAFAAHGHGQLFKQWSYRFGAHRDDLERRGDWRMLALSTFSLIIVLAAAGGSRYAAVMHQLAGQPQVNILGAEAAIQIDPLRDVLLSLLWNVMAWAVGVFIAYMAHDKDPDYMDATAQYTRAHHVYTRRRRPYLNRLRQIEARLTKEIERIEAAARSRAADASAERDLLAQVDAHEAALVNALASVTSGNAQTYRANLAQLAAQRGGVVIERIGPDPAEISVAELRNAPLIISADMIRSLA
jgi:hypothetical protein